jgi:tetratricopeptide (TPR) repeat protein
MRAGSTPVFAVFANYVLDVLPAQIVRKGTDGPEQLCLRVHDSAAAPGGSAAHPAENAELAARLHTTALEAAFLPCPADTPFLEAALADPDDGAPVILNGSALTLLMGLTRRLAPGGFILINDYGVPKAGSGEPPAVPQRFGDTIAVGLNFPLIESVLQSTGASTMAPDDDPERAIHTRLIGAIPAARSVSDLFVSIFSAAADAAIETPAAEARAHAASGRRDEALGALRNAIATAPYDWQLLGWAGEYVGLGLGNPGPGAELARAALEINPWTSAWLWNVLGDCRFADGEIVEAEAAYRAALLIAPADPRGNLNLAYTRALAGCPDEALAAVGQGLAGDRSGEWRDRLLRKQAEILEQVSAGESARRDGWSRRAMTIAAAVSMASTASRPCPPFGNPTAAAPASP